MICLAEVISRLGILGSIPSVAKPATRQASRWAALHTPLIAVAQQIPPFPSQISAWSSCYLPTASRDVGPPVLSFATTPLHRLARARRR
jgi:hypothetical protein